MNLKEKIKTLAEEHQSEIAAIRHHLHAHPELSFNESATAAFISQKLNAWGITHQTGIGGNGITGFIQSNLKGNTHGKCIALRADMDALPIHELNDVSYKSVHAGVMHACGHDVHSAALLGALRIIKALQDTWSGTVKFIFQPGEEKLPGGASLLIQEGVLENPRPDAIIAQHVYTPLAVGTAGFRRGKYMASADEIYITVHGKGGHAAEPEKVNNPIFTAAKLLVALEQLIQEVAAAPVPTVLNFGRVAGAGATNVIPDVVTIDGTLRTMDETWRREVQQKMKQVVEVFSIEQKQKVDCRIDTGYPCLINNEALTDSMKTLAGEYLGLENVADLNLRMAAEDFAFYSQQIPACFYRIGTGNPSKGIVSSVHTSTFNIDEEALPIASGLMAWMALRFLTC